MIGPRENHAAAIETPVAHDQLAPPQPHDCDGLRQSAVTRFLFHRTVIETSGQVPIKFEPGSAPAHLLVSAACVIGRECGLLWVPLEFFR